MADVWVAVSAFAWRKCQFSVIIALLGNWEEKTQGYLVEAVDFVYLHIENTQRHPPTATASFKNMQYSTSGTLTKSQRMSPTKECNGCIL